MCSCVCVSVCVHVESKHGIAEYVCFCVWVCRYVGCVGAVVDPVILDCFVLRVCCFWTNARLEWIL